MRTILILFLAVFALLSISSCESKYFEAIPVDPNAPVSYSVEIEPLFAAKCSQSGCHNGAIPPNLLMDKSYTALIEGLYVDTLQPAESILMIKLRTNMPPGDLMPSHEIQKVENWIKQGAKDN